MKWEVGDQSDKIKGGTNSSILHTFLHQTILRIKHLSHLLRPPTSTLFPPTTASNRSIQWKWYREIGEERRRDEMRGEERV